MKSYMCRMALMLVCLGSGWTLAARAADAPAPGKAEAKTRLTEGQPAPAFSLASTDGKTASPADYKGRWLLLFFYAKSFTPGPEKEVASLRGGYPQLQKMGVEVLGVSRDDLATQKRFKTENQLPFELLSDPDKTAAQAYQVLGLGGLYQRRSFLIDPKGRIAHIFYGVTVNKHAEEVVDALRKLQAEAEGR